MANLDAKMGRHEQILDIVREAMWVVAEQSQNSDLLVNEGYEDMDTKFEQFTIALRKLCVEHKVVLTARGMGRHEQILDIVREAMWVVAEQSQNSDKSPSEMRALVVALFGEELVKAALDG